MKSIGGFYYVRADGENYECKARGSFRKSGNSPVAGDRENISVPNDGFCAIEEILPRKNKLRRPALANLDILLLVCSTVEPLPNFTIIDKMTAAAVNNNMEPVIVVTKNDLKNGDKIADIYRHAGFEVFLCSEDDSSQTEELKSYLSGKVSAFIGNSGVGKSTLLNKLFPSLSLETGQTSKKLGRGRHTTRVVELFELDGCFVADTPGFSTVDLQRYEMIDKSRLQYCLVCSSHGARALSLLRHHSRRGTCHSHSTLDAPHPQHYNRRTARTGGGAHHVVWQERVWHHHSRGEHTGHPRFL